MESKNLFNKYVKINENFKKSTNLSHDKGNTLFLKDFILSPSNQENLEYIVSATQNGQGAFTFTGPYGSGKSSFALFLSELLAPSNEAAYQICYEKITNKDLQKDSYISSSKKRTIIPVVGEPISPLVLLSNALGCEPTSQAILEDIRQRISKNDGFILIVDEMGKLLEHSTLDSHHDIYLFQQIAELANNSDGRFIFIGILHQSFIEYASGLNKNTQDEWYKIHGRFSDLVIDTSNEEKLDLIGKTITYQVKPKDLDTNLTDATIETIKKNRPINEISYKALLSACWPLNPIIALLLGPLSLKSFGQNQRSIFTFLSSEEPGSFQNFLNSTPYSEDTFYGIDRFWEYIKSNFDFVLSRSVDARRWILAQEVLDKLYAQASVSKIDVEVAATILKFISLLEIFRGNTGLVASNEIIRALFFSSQVDEEDLFSLSSDDIDQTLEQLCDLSLIREAYDKSGYVLFDGSDFDIDAALTDALQQVVSVDYVKLNKIASFQPIVAKKHYHETGTMRWMELSLIPFNVWQEQKDKIEAKLDNTKFGAWIILIPETKTEYDAAKVALQERNNFNKSQPIVLSLTPHFEIINSYAKELLALEWIEKNTASLIGDRIARHEIENRKSHLSLAIREIIADLKRETEWYTDKLIGKLSDASMSRIASDLATEAFSKSLSIHTELLNNNKPSGSANGAVNALLRRMVLNRGEKDLGFEDGKYPAEWGLYKILLEQTGIYQKQYGSEYYLLGMPKDSKLLQLWDDTDLFLAERDKCTVKEIYKFWEQSPYGIKKGLHSSLFLTYILSKEGNIAAYLQGMYLPEISELFVDYLIKESNDVEIKYIDMSESRQDYIRQLHQDLGKEFKSFKYCQPNTLDISRKLVAFINNLNPWIMRTKKLQRPTMRLRDLLKGASDPNKLIFEDIANLYNLPIDNLEKGSLQPLIDSLKELEDAYPNLINNLSGVLYTALQIDPNSIDLEALHQRAESVNHVTGDFRIDALASRLSVFDPNNRDDIAGIASLAANKPIRDWIDLDVERAVIELGVLCDGFKRAELYTHLKGRPSSRRSFVVMSSFNGEDIQQDIDFSLPAEAVPAIDTIKKAVREKLVDKYDIDVLRAALLELSLELSEEK